VTRIFRSCVFRVLFILAGLANISIAQNQRKEVQPVLVKEGLKWYRQNDFSKAIPWLKKAAEQGDKDAQLYMGIISYYGLGTRQDYTAAMNWFRESARRENASAEARLGGMYFAGLGGVAISWKEALRLFRQSSSRGDARGMARLGCMLMTGQGVTKDDVMASGLFHRVQALANLGDEEAQYQLGFLYYTGIGFSQNYKEAMAWYLKAEKQGNRECLIQVAEMYEYGRGVARNKKEAIKWYWKVMSLGPDYLWHKTAEKSLKRLNAD
jgi:TPR repeat protein